MYSLKNIRRIRGLDGSGITASIYRDNVRIGWVQLSADGGTALFTFDIEGERAGFEQHVERWWQTAQTQVGFDLTAIESAGSNPMAIPPLPAKQKCWVTALVQDVSPEKKVKTAA